MALVVPPVTDLLRRARSTDGTSQPPPMFPTLIAVRNGRVVATVSTPRLATTLHCATTLAVGTDPQALVVAAQGEVEEGGGATVLSYSVMTRDRQAKLALQEVREEETGLAFGTPFDGGEPQNPRILTVLAEAMAQRPVDPRTVARRDRSGTFGEDPFLPAEQGRVVIDAGTVRTLQERVEGIAGRALYLARSPEAGRLALEAGLPRTSLLTSESSEVSSR